MPVEFANRIKNVKGSEIRELLKLTEKPEVISFAGGLFTWIELPENIDASKLIKKCLKNNVAYVSGAAFFSNGGKYNCFRVNYSTMPEDRIVESVKRLAIVLKEFM